MFCLSRLQERRFPTGRARRARGACSTNLSGDFARSAATCNRGAFRILQLKASRFIREALAIKSAKSTDRAAHPRRRTRDPEQRDGNREYRWPNDLRGAQREPISTLARTGRYRSGQTGQTVNLLALRLRWFESSPAQFRADRLRRILMASSLATFAAAVAPAPALASAAITAPSAAGRPCLSRTGFVDGQRSTFNGLTVDFGNSVLRVLLRAHCD